MDRRFIITGVPAAIGLAALAGCGSRDNTTAPGGGASGATGGGEAAKTVKIGVSAPFSGALSALGLGIQHSVELAVKQANDSGAVPGWTLEVVAVDDEGKPDIGKNAATQLASDDDVIAVVGNLNSSVSQQTQAVFAQAKIAQISPANTNPSLSGKDKGQRPYPSYFRTCTTDDIQGPFAARYLYESGITKVATVHDKKTYGQGLVSAFTTEFEKLGGQIVAAETADSTDANAAVVSKIRPLAPQAIYYGGEYPLAGPMSRALGDAGLSVPLMGGDGIYSAEFVKVGGRDNDLATSVGAPTDSTEAGKKFLADYEAAGYAEAAEAYGGYSFDAANAIIEALKVSLADATDAKSAREATIEAIGKVSFEGITGPVAFDEFGDATTKVLTVYKVTSGAWTADKTDDFE